MQALGLATIFIGAGGVLKYMLVMENGSFTTRGTMLLIFSLVIGCILGQWLDIEAKMEKLGIKLKAAVKIKNDNLFVDGFVTASLIVCVGVNLVREKTFKVANMLPALLIPIVWEILCVLLP